MPNNICDGKERTDCIKGVKNSVEVVSKQKKNVQTGELKGNLDETRTEFIGTCASNMFISLMCVEFSKCNFQ